MRFRPISAFRDINRDLTQLRDEERVAEEKARVELAQRARVFSRNSRKVVDDTMSLSAVLMRAGEVEEANRLLVEVDREVKNERAALIETVTNAKTRKEIARHKLTRLRLARLVATAILGSSLMGFSAFGLAVARYLAPDAAQGSPTQVTSAQPGSGSASPLRDGLRQVEYAGMKISLTNSQLAEFKRLTAAGDHAQLAAFLNEVLSGDLADKMTTAVASAASRARAVGKKATAALGAAKKSAATTQSSDNSSSDTNKDKKSSADDGSGGGGDDPEEEKCENGDEDPEQRSGFSPGGCIPILNEETPL